MVTSVLSVWVDVTMIVEIGGKAVCLVVVKVVGRAVCRVVVVDGSPPTPRPQRPNSAWHPSPQSSSVAPHCPFSEQQLPYDDPRQEYRLSPPHVPSGVISSCASASPNRLDSANAKAKGRIVSRSLTLLHELGFLRYPIISIGARQSFYYFNSRYSVGPGVLLMKGSCKGGLRSHHHGNLSGQYTCAAIGRQFRAHSWLIDFTILQSS